MKGEGEGLADLSTYFDQVGSGTLPPALVSERSDLSKFGEMARKSMGRVLVAVAANGELSGLAVVSVSAGPEVEYLFLARTARGTGLADKLMAAAEAKLRGMTPASCTRVFLHVLPGNHRARRFYERCAFENKGEVTMECDVSGGRTVPLQVMHYEKDLR